MTIESDDEARRAAEAIIADIASGNTEIGDVLAAIYSDPDDARRIGSHLAPLLTEAIQRWRNGDETPETSRLVAFALNTDEAGERSKAEAAIARAERDAERRAATLALIQPPPDIATRMTGIGPHGVPLPDDVKPAGDFLATRLATPEPLMAFYIDHLRANGWTIHLDTSRPITTGDLPPQCYFSSPTLPGRYLEVLVGQGDDGVATARIWICDHEEYA